MPKFVRILPIDRMMADADVDGTISTAEKQEHKHWATSMYSLLRNNPKRSAQRCPQGSFGSPVISNSSCCLVLLTTWQSRHSSTAMVGFCQCLETLCSPWHTTLFSPTYDAPCVLVRQSLTWAMKISQCFLLVRCYLMW